jgi:kinesin family protein C2/C3
MSAVIVCLLALRDRFGSHVGEGLQCSLEENGMMPSMLEFSIRENGHSTQNSGFREESKQVKGSLQKISKSPGEIVSIFVFFFQECP